MATESLQPMTQPQNLRHLLYMYGAATQVELNNFLDVNSVDDEARKRQIKTAWPAAAEIFQELMRTEAGEPDSITTRALPPETATRAEILRADPTFINTFPNYPLSFEEVEIDKLVACQRIVHIEYVEQVRMKYERSDGDLFAFCLAPSQDTTPVVIGRTAQNTFTASSENPGLRFLGAFEKPYRPELLQPRTPSGQPVHSIILVLGYGGSTANAYRVGRRLILNNGFHRLYTLRMLGITYAPLVVQRITHPEVELPPVIAELPRDYLLNNPRPALLKDFLHERLTCEITQRSFLKAVQLGWGLNENLVPR